MYSRSIRLPRPAALAAVVVLALVVAWSARRRTAKSTWAAVATRPVGEAAQAEAPRLGEAEAVSVTRGEALPETPESSRPNPPASAYDNRSLDEMAQAWAGEADDPEWTLNVRTFVGAIIDTMAEGGAGHSPESLSIRCRQSVCRIDSDGRDVAMLRELSQSAREEQLHVQVRLNNSNSPANPGVEVYVGRDHAP
jgi:hypothetical protein